jgi:hypothetical protein
MKNVYVNMVPWMLHFQAMARKITSFKPAGYLFMGLS